ncbi:MAG: DNA polymerase III subunit beta [bacterium]
MHFVLDREIFAEALGTVVAVVPSRSPFPVLQNILIEVEKSRLSLTGTDNDTVVRKEVEIEGKTEEGRTVLDARRLTELVRASQGTEVSLHSDESMVRFESGRLKASLVQLAPEEFPELLKLPEEVVFEFPLDPLLEMFDTCCFAASREDARPVMAGINWEVGKNEARMVATDGYRLVCASRKVKTGTTARLLVPPKSIDILPRGEEKVKVFCNPKMAGFVLKDTTVITRMIEGSYPDYEKVIPKSCPNRAVVNLEAFSLVLRRAIIIANPINKQVSLEFKSGGMVVRAENPEAGKSEEELDCQYQGNGLRVGFNGGYLLDILHHISTEEIAIELSSSIAPVLLKPVDTREDTQDLFVLMPARLD